MVAVVEVNVGGKYNTWLLLLDSKSGRAERIVFNLEECTHDDVSTTSCLSMFCDTQHLVLPPTDNLAMVFVSCL